MKEKVGRNAPCPCGSGRKYKKCCLPADTAARGLREIPFSQLPPEVRDKVLSVQNDRQTLNRMGIRINYVSPVLHQGRKAWGIGSRVMFTGPKMTFHEFTIGILSDSLGQEWWDSERLLAEEDQHFLVRCFDAYVRWKGSAKHDEVAPGIYAGDPNGYVQHLASAAFDVITLMHTNSLPEDLISRLRHHDQYQGARYEIGIAAIFSRLDFELEFTTREQAEGKKRPEFIASDRHSRLRVAVEVKSKHRAGVINQPGEFDAGTLHANVSRQVREAIQQGPDDIPFVVCIDVNFPPTAGVSIMDKLWLRDITEILERKPYTHDDPDPISALAVTNYAQHYEEETQASAGEHVISISEHVRHPLPSDFLEDFSNALSAYGNVPNFDVKP